MDVNAANVEVEGDVTKDAGEEKPDGLEKLEKLSKVFVRQKADIAEAFTYLEKKNSYKILDDSKAVIYTAKEESNFFLRLICKKKRSFVMHVKTLDGTAVIKIEKKLKCCDCALRCYPCCIPLSYYMRVEAPPGRLCGYLYVRCSIKFKCKILFIVKDNEKNPLFHVVTKSCLCNCCNITKVFKIYSVEDTEPIGSIKKKWAGLVKELLTDADMFCLEFPQELDVHKKALLLSAVILVDYMFYEREN